MATVDVRGARLAWRGRGRGRYLSVSPRIRQSGTSLKDRSCLSRSGHAAMRSALYMPGLAALRYNPVVEPFGQRLRATGIAPKAVIGAAMHKVVHLI